MTDNDIKTICEKIDSLHEKILKSKFAETVTESEMLSLILAVCGLQHQQSEIEKLYPYKLHYGNLRMEIAREFADRLYERAFRTTINDGGIECYTKVVAASEIYDLLKEMENEH